jgi:cephalosporin hydroxylase
MEPELCRSLNMMSLELLAAYLGEKLEVVNKLYQELLADKRFLAELNTQIKNSRKYFQKGVFRHEKLDSVDWMSIQRIILYVLVRLYKPAVCLETGVFYGGNTSFILNALRVNGTGKLISIDLPGNEIKRELRHHLVGDSEDIPEGLDIGFIVHENLKEQWTLIRGDSLKEILKIKQKIDLYIHDSDHSFNFITREMSLVWNKLKADAIILADDLDWSNGFFSFCVEKKLYPLIITDNGKSGLRARTGIARLKHPFRQKLDIVG